MTTSVNEAKLRSDWDAASTYDVLENPGTPIGVFVGREDLLRSLQAAVVQVEKRGTILVSGYRGSGKTTLVIESLRRAAQAFDASTKEKKPRLLPIVLNVSEVATSLSTPETDAKLQIDPRRLLIALLRAFRQKHDKFKGESDLQQQIDLLYRKATAAAFKLARNSGQTRESVLQKEAGLKLDSAELLKVSLFPAGLISLGLASLGAADTLVDKCVKGIAAAGAIGAATLGVLYNRTRTSKETETAGIDVTYEHDNSQQELENDLKDLLQSLQEKGWRTVIVLEELDKLDHQGQELDGVIRYFKNLFTQAPALFIFVTDKAYYDRIGGSIRKARRARSYAVEHTFFTHRVFVGRPSTRDCLEFIHELLAQPEHQQLIKGIYTGTGRWATESYDPRTQSAAAAPPLSLFVRVLLFRASNHLFDLKAELQRFVRTGANGPILNFEAEMFPPEDQVLAKFQDLLVDKARTFEIKGGRGYANEVLHDCLAGVFYDLGSARQRLEKDLLVDENSDGGDGPLEPGERKRVNEAVLSLLDDLARGGALRRLSDGSNPATFVWLDKPAQAFSFVRRLDEHEEKLAGELKQWALKASQLRAFAVEGPIADQAVYLEQDFASRAAAVSDLDTKINVDEALMSSRQAAESYVRLVAELNHTVSSAATTDHGLMFESIPLGSWEPGDGARLLMTCDGDPRSQTPGGRGIVILAEGSRDAMLTDVRVFIARTRPQRVALVCLSVHFTSDDAAKWQKRWEEELSGLRAWENGIPQIPRIRVLGIERPDSRKETSGDDESGIRRAAILLARDLIAGAIWAVRPWPEMGSGLNDAPQIANAVSSWLAVAESTDARPILWTSTVPLLRLSSALREALWLYHPDAPWCIPLPGLSKVGDLSSDESRFGSDFFFSRLFLSPPNLGETPQRRHARLIELLQDERGIVVTDIAPPMKGSTLFQALGGHRWATVELGSDLDRIEDAGSAAVRLDTTDGSGPPGSSTVVKIRWGRYRMTTPLRAGEGTQSSVK